MQGKGHSRKLRVAAVQAAPVYLDRNRTTDRACRLIRKAGKGGADLVAFPEAFLPGYPYFAWTRAPTTGTPKMFVELFKNAIPIPSPTVRTLCDAAKAAKAHVVIGMTEREGSTLYNTIAFIDRNGHFLGRRRKLVPTVVERTIYGRGDGRDLLVFDTGMGKLGGLICGEHNMDLLRYSFYAFGEQIHTAHWPGYPAVGRWKEHDFNGYSETAVRYHSLVGGVFSISSHGFMSEEIVKKLDAPNALASGGGSSIVVSPHGKVIAGPLRDKEGMLYADIDLDEAIEEKYRYDPVGHYARPDLLKLLINKRGYSPFAYVHGKRKETPVTRT